MFFDRSKLLSSPATADQKNQGVHWKESFWEIAADALRSNSEKIRFKARAVILTAPLPQSLELLKSSNVTLSDFSLLPLSQVKYSCCLAMILEPVFSDSKIIPALLKNPSKNLAGIYDQKGKGIRCEKNTWVVHASSEYSSELWNLPEPEIFDRLETETRMTLSRLFSGEFPSPFSFSKVQLHKWRYSEPQQVLTETFHRLVFHDEEKNGTANPFLLAGDSFSRPSVEGAFCSGTDAGNKLVSLLQQN